MDSPRCARRGCGVELTRRQQQLGNLYCSRRCAGIMTAAMLTRAQRQAHTRAARAAQSANYRKRQTAYLLTEIRALLAAKNEDAAYVVAHRLYQQGRDDQRALEYWRRRKGQAA